DQIVDLIVDQVKDNLVSEKISTDFEDLYIEAYPTKSRSFLKIEDGCNQFCSYCVIPYSRGRQRSGDHNKILEEARILSKTNKEIVLTGIHTGRYDDGEYDLYKLLCDLVKIEDLETIRISSIEITEINDQIIELMKDNDKIAHHLHIPVQSCDDTILKLMNRPYTIEEYIDRVEYIRKMIPDISISTDLIVGFPKETDELFNNTLNNLRKIAFSFIHVFPYSRKEGTVADRMDGHIDPKIKKQRVKDVMELEKEYTQKFHERFLGRDVRVLIEKCEDGYSYGYSKEYIYTKVKGIHEIGRIIDVRIDNTEKEVTGSAVI
ncbi:MAG: MiaB/RimO family radical SAM methylthiotransferase, partial [Erysipelotrichaceae bacterium]|nr:MiaB/RimO family radical SAM methylthiotransferase [Erysipelotrichaceae bacterium]